MEILYVGAIAGLVLGAILSVVFGVYSKSSAESYIRSLFGMSSYDLIFGGIVFILVASFLFLATISGVVKDLWYPTTKPVNFTIETLLMAFMPALVFLIMTPLRGYPITGTTYEEFMVLVVKFGLLHVLLQFSGFYSNIFPPKK
jgi:hypothetical protein